MLKSNFYKKIVITILMIVTVISADFANIFVNTAQAAINEEINYQGKLTNASNVAVADGLYDMEFSLYTTLTGGSPIWTETLTTTNQVQVTNGLFSVMLGSTTPFTGVNFNQTLYLGVTIEADAEMSPRKIIGAVPAAMVAKTANALEGLSSSQFLRSDAQNATSSTNTFLNIIQTGTGKIAEFFGNVSQSVFSILSNGNVGIGTSTPYAALSVVGVSGVVADHYTSTSTTNASVFPYASTTALTVAGRIYSNDATISNTITLANLNGPLQAVNGLVSASTTLSAAFGGTGISTLPSYGNILVGQENGSYVLTATSSLGLASFAYPFTISTNYGVNNQATTGIAWFQNGLNASSTSNFVYASTTALSATTICITTDCRTSWPAAGGGAFPFDPVTFGATNANSTSTLIGFTNGLYSLASSTIGDGSQTGGLTISGGATTTGNAYFGGNVGIGTTSPYAKLSIHAAATSLYNQNLFSIASSTAAGVNSTIFSVNADKKVGIGTTTPFATLAVHGTTMTGGMAVYPAFAVYGGDGIDTGQGIILKAGEGQTYGGSVELTAGDYALSDGNGGDILIKAGLGGSNDGQAGDVYIDAGTAGGTGRNGAILFSTVRTGANVGIGTTSPYAKLSVVGEVLGTYFTSTSTTLASTLPYASTTALSATTICITTDCRTSWPAAGGGVYPFTPATNYGVNNQATTGIAWFQNGLNASSTSNFAYASTTAISATTICITGDICRTTWPTSSGGGLGWASTTSPNTDSIFTTALYNVGIGTTSPNWKLSVSGMGYFGDNVISSYFTATSTTATSTFAGGLNVGSGNLFYDYYTGVTSISSAEFGNLNFDTDAGAIAWVDMEVTTASVLNTVESYTALLDGNPMITVFGKSNGLGGLISTSTAVGIGTSTPMAMLDIYTGSSTLAATGHMSNYDAVSITNQATSSFANTIKTGLNITSTGPWSGTGSSNIGLYVSSVTGGTNNFDAIFNGGGNVGIGTTSPYAKLSVVGEIVGSYFSATSTTRASTFPYASTTALSATTLCISTDCKTAWPTGGGLGWASTTSPNTDSIFTTALYNVGIGTSSPYAKLSISGVAGQTNPFFSIASTSDSTTPFVTVASTTNFQIDGGVINPAHKASLIDGAGGAHLDGATGLYVSGNYAYITAITDDYLEIVDISNPSAPVHKSAVLNGDGGALLDGAIDVFVVGKYAYVVSNVSNALEIIDVSNPAAPVHKGSISDGEGGAVMNLPYGIYVSGNYAYVAALGSDALEIIDVSNPATPVHKGSIVHGAGGALLDGAKAVFVSGKYAYVVSNVSDSLEIVDVTDPSAPVHAGSIADGAGGAMLDGASGIYVSGNYAYISSDTDDALQIVDVSNPASPAHKGSISDGTGGALLNGAADVFVSGNYAYVASNESNALEIIDVSNPASPVHKGVIVSGSGGARLDSVNEVFVVGNNAYVTSSLSSDSLEIVDVGALNVSNAQIGSLQVGNLFVDGFTQFNNGLQIKGGLNIGGSSMFNGSLSISDGTFSVASTSTSTFAGSIAVTEVNATSTFAGGINITDGCFAIDGVCIGAQGAQGIQGPAGAGVEGVIVTTFVADGTWTKADYTNLSFTEVITTAGGGGGGGADSDGSAETGAGGGGAGGTALEMLSAASLGTTESVLVSTAGGTGGVGNGSGGNGTAGGDASFGAHNSATGGNGGTGTTVSGTTCTNLDVGPGGAGAGATGGDINLTGGAGTGPVHCIAESVMGGVGGASYWGGGGAGGVSEAANSCSAGGSGTYGSGGGGAVCEDSTAGADGGAGVDGIVVTMNYTSGAADLAEWYETREDVEAGDVVAISSDIIEYSTKIGLDNTSVLERATSGSDVVGVISTSPYKTMGADVLGSAKHPRAVALAGRVPVKVTEQNGKIHAGDLLTVSPVPGHAMLSKKAGVTIGRALEDSNCVEGEICKVMVMVHTSYSTGALLKSAYELSGLDISVIPGNINIARDISKAILAEMIQEKKNMMASTSISEVFTDRVVAGLEVITPTLYADDVFTNRLSGVEDDGLQLEFTDKGIIFSDKAKINTSTSTATSTAVSTSTSPVITFDTFGNAFFAGELRADKVIGNNIIGLEVMAGKFTNLTSEISSLIASSSASSTSQYENILQNIANLIATTTIVQSRLTTLESVKPFSINELLATSTETIFAGAVVMNGSLTISSIGSGTSTLSLLNDVEFFGTPYFTTDTAGFAVVKKGSKKVSVVFDREYLAQPIVNTSISLDAASSTEQESALAEEVFSQDIKFVVTGKNKKGFTILLNKAVKSDLQFSWTAFAVKGAKTYESNEFEPEPTPSSVAPTPATTPAPVTNTVSSPTTAAVIDTHDVSTSTESVKTSTEEVVETPTSSPEPVTESDTTPSTEATPAQPVETEQSQSEPAATETETKPEVEPESAPATESAQEAEPASEPAPVTPEPSTP